MVAQIFGCFYSGSISDDSLFPPQSAYVPVEGAECGFQVLEFKGESNHVHALIEYPPKLSISQIVNALKGVSSRRYGQAGQKKPHKEPSFVTFGKK